MMKLVHYFSVLLMVSPLWAVDLVLGHFEYQVDYEVTDNPNDGWGASISYDLDGSFADNEGIVRIDTSDVRLLATPNSRFVTANPPSEFGVANEPLWILPQINRAGQLFFGFRAVFERGVFQSNNNDVFTPSVLGDISTELVGVTGTGAARGGDFALWTSGGFGLEFLFNSTDGIDSNDVRDGIDAGSHTHFNWGFTKPGAYTVAFRNSGRLNPQFGGVDTEGDALLNFSVPHDGYVIGEAQWRLGTGEGDVPAAAIYDQEMSVDYATNQVALIAENGTFTFSSVSSNEIPLGRVGISDSSEISFPTDDGVTVSLLSQVGPGNVSLTVNTGSYTFSFDADGIYRLELQASQGGVLGKPFSITVLNNLEVDYSYAEWADSFERAHQLAEGTLADPEANSDSDTLTNGLEFLLFWHGFDPAVADGSLMPCATFENGVPTFEFLRDLHKDDFASTPLELAAAFSPDLETPFLPWRRFFSEGFPDGFYEDGNELGNETSFVMRRCLLVPQATPESGFFRFEQRAR